MPAMSRPFVKMNGLGNDFVALIRDQRLAAPYIEVVEAARG